MNYYPPSQSYYNEYQAPNQYNPNPYNPYLGSAQSRGQQAPYHFSRQNQQIDDVFNDFQKKQTDYVQNNLRSGAAISEMEMTLEGERRKAKDLRQTLENDLEAEKRMRIDFENKLIKLKEESQKRELYVEDIDYKLQQAEQESNALAQENRAIKDEIRRLQEMYGGRIRELEDKCAIMKRQQIQQDERYNIEYDRLKKETDQKYDALNREWEFRNRAMEEKYRNLNQVKNDLEQEIRILQDNIMKTRLEAEEQLREEIVRVQEEEMRKFMSNLRSLEQKLKACDESRENLLRKNNDILRDVAEKDRVINQQQMEFDQDTNRMKQELSEYHNQLNQSNIAREKLRNELQGRDAALQRMEADLMEAQKYGARQREQNKQEIDAIQTENVNEKRILEDIRDQQARKINDQDKVIKQMEQEIERLRADQERLCNLLQNNINRSIYQTINETNVSRFDQQRPQFGRKYE